MSRTYCIEEFGSEIIFEAMGNFPSIPAEDYLVGEHKNYWVLEDIQGKHARIIMVNRK